MWHLPAHHPARAPGLWIGLYRRAQRALYGAVDVPRTGKHLLWGIIVLHVVVQPLLQVGRHRDTAVGCDGFKERVGIGTYALVDDQTLRFNVQAVGVGLGMRLQPPAPPRPPRSPPAAGAARGP